MEMLLTYRVSDTKANCRVAGAIDRPCSRCGEPVTVSPTSFEVMDKVPIVCTRCITVSEVRSMRLHVLDGQRNELLKLLVSRN